MIRSVMTMPPTATMPANAGPKRMAAAKDTVSDSDIRPSALAATAQRSPAAAATRNIARSR
jgi:hypothetical protein